MSAAHDHPQGPGQAASSSSSSSLPEVPESQLPLYTKRVHEPKLRKPPFWAIAGFMIVVTITFVPLVVAARGRVTKSDQPRIHIVQDMDSQPKYREQQTSPVFLDGRADRPKVPGTVARGKLQEDDHYERGYTLVAGGAAGGQPQVKFYDGFPKQVEVNARLLERGRVLFDTYCAACHGFDGSGNGPVHRRETELAEGKGWVQPSTLYAGEVPSREAGHIYNTINNGIRTMGSYGGQITDPHDRWAVVAYVRALQVSQAAAAAAAEAAEGQ